MQLIKSIITHIKINGFLETYREMGSHLRGIARNPAKPNVLHIELNNTCNLKCEMCPRDHLNRAPQNMDFEIYKKIINESVSLGIQHIRLFMFGEPLLYPKLIEAITYAKSKGIACVDFNTNANLLDRNKTKLLAFSGLDAIIFSVDGFSKKTYESIRLNGDYDKCVKNILHFLKYIKINNIKISTAIQTIKFPDMIDELNNYVLYWKDKVDHVGVTELNPMQGLAGKITFTKIVRIVCREPFNKMVILSDGSVTTCCDDFNGKLNLGNVNENTIKELWHGDKWIALRRDFLRKNYVQYDICNNCIFSYCKQ